MSGWELLLKAAPVIGTVLKTQPVQDWLSGVIDRGLAGRASPDTRRFIKDIRTAQLSAIKCVALRYAEWLSRNPSKMGPNDRIFADDLRKFVDKHLKVFSVESVDDRVVTDKDLELVLGDLIDFRETADSSEQAEMRSTAIQRALDEIKHEVVRDDCEVPSNFRRLFEGDPDKGQSGWYEEFSGLVMNKIAKNQQFSLTWLAHQSIEIKQLIDKATDQIEEIRKSVTIKKLAAFKWTQKQKLDPKEKDSVGSFRFMYAFDKLQGFESDFEKIECALLSDIDPQQFKWLGLYGDAGSGKSRFAMELLERNQWWWKACGFVHHSVITADHAAQWVVEYPTFLIIDYAASYPGLVDFVETFASRKELDFPVRLLIIERNKHNKKFVDLLNRTDEQVWKTRAELPDKSSLHQLSALTRQQIVALMKARIGRSSVKVDKPLDKILEDFDPLCRPLFAAIVADALANDSLPKDKEDREEARFALFHFLINRERKNFWKARMNGPESENILAQHETLAALATMVRGLQNKTYDKLKLRNPLLPEPVDPDFYAAMAEDPAEGSYDYPAVTPDLIGECFVLDMMQERDSPDKKSRKNRQNWLIETAWCISPWEMAVFAHMCFQDYPQRTASLNYFLPQSGKMDSAKSALIRDIAAERADASQDRPTIEELKQAFELAELIDLQMLDEAQQELALVRNAAAVWCQVANLAARAVNEHLGHEPIRLDPTLERKIKELSRSRLAFDKATGRSDAL